MWLIHSVSIGSGIGMSLSFPIYVLDSGFQQYIPEEMTGTVMQSFSVLDLELVDDSGVTIAELVMDEILASVHDTDNFAGCSTTSSDPCCCICVVAPNLSL